MKKMKQDLMSSTRESRTQSTTWPVGQKQNKERDKETLEENPKKRKFTRWLMAVGFSRTEVVKEMTEDERLNKVEVVRRSPRTRAVVGGRSKP